MDLFFELFITISLSFMLTFLFSKLIPVDPMPDHLDAPQFSASHTKLKSEPKSGLKSLVKEDPVEEEEEEMISGESVEVRRFQTIPAMEYVKFEECAVEESKRPVEFHREIVVSDVNPEYFEGEFLERSGFRNGTCEIEVVDLEDEIEEVGVEDDPDSEIGDWEAIERKDFEELHY